MVRDCIKCFSKISVYNIDLSPESNNVVQSSIIFKSWKDSRSAFNKTILFIIDDDINHLRAEILYINIATSVDIWICTVYHSYHYIPPLPHMNKTTHFTVSQLSPLQ